MGRADAGEWGRERQGLAGRDAEGTRRARRRRRRLLGGAAGSALKEAAPNWAARESRAPGRGGAARRSGGGAGWRLARGGADRGREVGARTPSEVPRGRAGIGGALGRLHQPRPRALTSVPGRVTPLQTARHCGSGARGERRRGRGRVARSRYWEAKWDAATPAGRERSYPSGDPRRVEGAGLGFLLPTAADGGAGKTRGTQYCNSHCPSLTGRRALAPSRALSLTPFKQKSGTFVLPLSVPRPEHPPDPQETSTSPLFCSIYPRLFLNT